METERMNQMVRLLNIEQHEFGFVTLREELIAMLECMIHDQLYDRYLDCIC